MFFNIRQYPLFKKHCCYYNTAGIFLPYTILTIFFAICPCHLCKNTANVFLYGIWYKKGIFCNVVTVKILSFTVFMKKGSRYTQLPSSSSFQDIRQKLFASSVDIFLYLSSLTYSVSEVVKLSTSYNTVSDNFNAVDSG